ncbi:hypothetical protein CMUS01_07088 [Colletotrichum musicola]|uniref:Uncharacterized protein n=1 Tax=Colletotrichum musicola TaxID=2175873 RepID=A0A8H6KIE8_9PEZI|nr:hypothetical protein CMUS01_07088 [Colletotrichum musicola]
MGAGGGSGNGDDRRVEKVAIFRLVFALHSLINFMLLVRARSFSSGWSPYEWLLIASDGCHAVTSQQQRGKEKQSESRNNASASGEKGGVGCRPDQELAGAAVPFAARD